MPSNSRSIHLAMFGDDRLLYSALQGTAIHCTAEQRDLTSSIANAARSRTAGRCLAQAAGITSRIVVRQPRRHMSGHELIAAMFILAGRRPAVSRSPTTNL